jgi:hypothetical protein
VCCGLAHRTVRCTMSVRRRTSHSRENWAALRYNSPDCPVCHRTIQCTSGGTAIQRNSQLQKERWQRYSEEQCTTESEAHRTVRCHTRTSSPTVNWVRTLTVGWRGGAPDCPVRPSTAAIPNGHLVVEGYKYPQPPQHQASKHSKHCIQYKSNSLHSKTQPKRSIHSKSPIQL